MSRRHAPGRTFYSFPAPEERGPYEWLWRPVSLDLARWLDIAESPGRVALIQTQPSAGHWLAEYTTTCEPRTLAEAAASLTLDDVRRAVEALRVAEAFRFVNPPPIEVTTPLGGAIRHEVWRASRYESLLRGAPWFLLPDQPAIVSGEDLEHRAVQDDADDHVKTLVELARAGRESDFRALGAMLGVTGERLDELWQGTVARAQKIPRVTAPTLGRGEG